MLQPGRSYSSGDQYRYGFSGKERDEDLGVDHYDFDARIYEGRLGRWMSVDPKTKAHESPFVGFFSNPILVSDPNGEDGRIKIKRNENGKGGTITVKTTIHVSGENAQKQVDAANGFVTKNAEKFTRTLTEKLANGEEASWKVNIEVTYVVAGTQIRQEGDNSLHIRKSLNGGSDARTSPVSTKDEEFNKKNEKSLNGSVRYLTGKSSEIIGIEGYAEVGQGDIVKVHEPLHTLGLSDRYDIRTGEPNPGFDNTNDIMSGLATDADWSIGDVHFQNLANFALSESKRLESIAAKKQESVDPNDFILKHQVDKDNKGVLIGSTPKGDASSNVKQKNP